MSEIVVLTGAGVSAESGLGTFRDRDGLWTQYDLAEVATPEGYAADPAKVLSFYNARRRNCRDAVPNPAHEALARLEAAIGPRLTLVTQNIDDLHERGGSGRVIHMHGELMNALCAACGARWGWSGDMAIGDGCTACGEAGRVRPDVVWFGEMPYAMETIFGALERCRLFVAIGTSGAVYPAAGFVDEARALGAETLEINLEASDAPFHRRLLGPAGETVPAWVDTVIGGR